MRITTGRSWGLISGELEKEMSQGEYDFCYADAHDFIKRAVASDWDVRILTYGNGEYQRYKIKTCRLLSELRIPVHVVTEPKKDFLRREIGTTEGAVLDTEGQVIGVHTGAALYTIGERHGFEITEVTENYPFYLIKCRKSITKN